MVKFLIRHPVSVLMAFLACCIVGVVTLFNIPVSLLPDIPIPEITIQLSKNNTSARELENVVVAPVRQQLNQLSHLKDIHSETRDGNAIIRLRFEYGTNTDLAFIEANEKVDAAMNYLPEGTQRPRVIKSSATDIPVEYLNLTLKGADNALDEERFLELSDYAETVVRRRIEQLPEVSMVDLTGSMRRQVIIEPDVNKLEVAGITFQELEQTLSNNNIEPGSMLVHDGHYEYNIRFSAVVRTLEDLRELYLQKNDRIYRFSDLAGIRYAPQEETGMALYKDKRCIRMALIKQADVNLNDMQTAVSEAVENLEKSNPNIEFHVTENQSQLLDYTISNLQQNLILAFLFVWLISVFFMNDFKSPFIIGISMVVSVIVSLLLFYLLHLSLNVVSLTGLILASGNMIDNSIVVTDNISQYRLRGFRTEKACVRGTNEVIVPMFSSALSSVAVFAPLVFLSGIAGALFYDQALSVTIGMLVSYLTGIILLPVLYKVFSGLSFSRFQQSRFASHPRWQHFKAFQERSLEQTEALYHHGITWIFAHKRSTLIGMLAVLPLCGLLFWIIPKEKMPDLHQQEMILSIDWNENIHVNENLNRTRDLLTRFKARTQEETGMVGQNQFLLDKQRQNTSSETSVYFKAADEKELRILEKEIRSYLSGRYPEALVSFAPSGTIFEKIFDTGEAEMVIECSPVNKDVTPERMEISQLMRDVEKASGQAPEGISFQQQVNLKVDQEKLLQYNIAYEQVLEALQTALKVNQLATLRSYQNYLPVVLGLPERPVEQILAETLIPVARNENGFMGKISLDRFVHVSMSEGVKTVVAGKTGEFIPLRFDRVEHPEKIINEGRAAVTAGGRWEAALSGSYFSNRKMLGELMIILLISILLMYFILTAQFENFTQPLIVLMEIPIDLAAGLIILMAAGHTLNLMSAIGMVVTCGIVVNDSILKVDIMNQLRKEGMPLMEAIHEAGRRRLNAILMTSLTSVVCMAPLLFTNDLGSNLEKPLALATIGGMLVGTPVSLFVVPLLYWWIYRKQDASEHRVSPSTPVRE